MPTSRRVTISHDPGATSPSTKPRGMRPHPEPVGYAKLIADYKLLVDWVSLARHGVLRWKAHQRLPPEVVASACVRDPLLALHWGHDALWVQGCPPPRLA